MIWLDLAGMHLRYYDTAGKDQDSKDAAYHTSCYKIMSIMSSAFGHKSLPVPEAEVTWHRQRVREHRHLFIFETNMYVPRL